MPKAQLKKELSALQSRDELDAKMEVVNDIKKKEVIVTFWRESNQESVRVTEPGVRDSGESVRPGDRPGVRAKELLTGKELDTVNYCTVPRTSKEILARVGVSYHSKNSEKRHCQNVYF